MEAKKEQNYESYIYSDSSNTSNAMKMYLKEIEEYPMLSAKEEVELAKAIIDSSEEAKEKFINANYRLVVSIAKRYRKESVDMLDLIQAGNIGLIKAVDNFDDTLNVKFSTYAVPMIAGELKRFLRDNASIRVSRSIKDTAYKAIYAKERIMKTSNKEPTISEISKKLELHLKKLYMP